MHQDERGRPVATLETNNHITERKRAEEALNKTQAELAHTGDDSRRDDCFHRSLDQPAARSRHNQRQ
jgi:hypothetical protein